MNKGGKNLLLLGTGAVCIAVFTVGAALAIYHDTGDIYIDRSRPGFLPDKKEMKKPESKQEYRFLEDTKIDEKTLEKFLEEYEKESRQLNGEGANFSGDLLSDGMLFGE